MPDADVAKIMRRRLIREEGQTPGLATLLSAPPGNTKLRIQPPLQLCQPDCPRTFHTASFSDHAEWLRSCASSASSLIELISQDGTLLLQRSSPGGGLQEAREIAAIQQVHVSFMRKTLNTFGNKCAR